MRSKGVLFWLGLAWIVVGVLEVVRSLIFGLNDDWFALVFGIFFAAGGVVILTLSRRV